MKNTTTTEIVSVKDNDSFKVFPNPVFNSLTISYDSTISDTVEIRLVDVNGKLLINKPVFTNQIEVGKLANGFYTIRIADKNGITTKVFVKQ